MKSGRTQWIVEKRRYFLDEWEDGVAERVRAERYDETAWARVLDAIYWWPEREGKHWPAEVILIPLRSAGDIPEPDAWAHFEAAVEIDDRYRWEEIPGPPGLG